MKINTKKLNIGDKITHSGNTLECIWLARLSKAKITEGTSYEILRLLPDIKLPITTSWDDGITYNGNIVDSWHQGPNHIGLFRILEGPSLVK